MELEIEKRYQTKCGDVVEAVAEMAGGDLGLVLCTVRDTIEGHEARMGTHHLYQRDGKWDQYPGGIHDIVSAE